MHDYIENHLTMDDELYSFAERINDKYDYAPLSNVSEWSKFITEFYKL